MFQRITASDVMQLFKNLVLIAFTATLLSGCMMAPIKPDLPHLNESIESRSTKADEARLIFFNNSNKLLFGLDNTGRINVLLNGKAVGGPNIGEYIQVQVPKGKYLLNLVHLDLFEFRSVHELDVQDDPLFVELRATVVSNEIQVHKSLPADNYLPKPFIRFEPSPKRASK
jgi:hypothetical protein